MGAGGVTCRDIVAAYQQNMTPSFTLGLHLADTRVAVRSNSRELMDALTVHYQDFLDDGGDPDIVVTALDGGPVANALAFALRAGEEDAKEEYVDLPDGRVVRKRRTGLWLVFGRGGNYVLGPCRQNVDQVVNAVNARCEDREMRAGALLFHAAGVCLDGRGLALSGFAGAGKSTLALEIMRHGASFVSNDRLLIGPGDAGLTMTGIARMPRINPGTLLHNEALAPILTEAEREAYAGLTPDALWRVERKYDVRIRDCFGPGRFRLRAGLRALVVLGWRRGGGELRATWTDIDAAPHLLPAFTKDVGVFFEQGPRRAKADAYRVLLGDCPVLVIHGGVDFKRAAALCLDVLGPLSASAAEPVDAPCCV
ncbi:HPr kinase [Solidesulfovibrio fructosivorans JJ]]|uniref:HPr kinase n=1 Tax=Solidesulfovibrio fructosivorans JJ] TaxID=596151 RepID=E1JVZ2_SOLFR|nr:HprK-related kinase B [Solidesulfovibrio fructosivorans]EFL51352.1 HPr kinase [Solidesulfovibrio fructosivorans JJ]]